MKYQETESVELKRQINESFDKEVVAFLNTRDGTIYIGVNGDGSIYGVEDTDSTMIRIKNIIDDQIAPSTEGLYEIGSILEGDTFVVYVKVHKGSGLYYLKKYGHSVAGCFYRNGTATVPMSEGMIRERFRGETKAASIGLIDVPSRMEDLTFSTLKIRLASRGIQINGATFNRSFNLLTKDGKFNLLAELLADRNFYSIQVCVFKGKNKNSYSSRNNFGQQSILQAYEDVRHYCEAQNETYIDDSSLPRKTRRMFDTEAFEEAWINAMVHNDWVRGNPPTIYWYSDRMEIMSYGKLKDGLSEEDFFQGVSDPVNRELMDIFLQCGLTDRSGHGVPRIVSAYGREAFRFLGSGILVTIPFDKAGFDSYEDRYQTPSYTSRSFKNSYSKTKEREEKICNLLKENGRLTAEQLARILNISIRTVQYDLRTMKAKGILAHTGSNKTGTWKILKD